MAERRFAVRAAVAVALPLALLACGTDSTGTPGGAADARPADPTSADATSRADRPSGEAADQAYPDIVAAELVQVGGGVFDIAVTLSSPYDTPERYADGWRVLAPDGTVLGEHQLLHDHASEQPFTRTQRGLSVPVGVDEVTIEGRDLVNGYGGGSLTVVVPGPDA